MAIVIVSSNLNNLCNAGNYETDPSTWGITLATINYTLSRQHVGSFPQKGIYAGKTLVFDGTFSSGIWFSGHIAKTAFQAGKNYQAKVWVRTPTGNPIGSLGITAKIEVPTFASGWIETQQSTAVAVFTDVWREIEIRVAIPQAATGLSNLDFKLNLYENGSETLNYQGEFYVDDFRIFEYVEEAPDPCTLEIDDENTVIVDESVPDADDGSITVAITGGTGTIEYSKDGGSNWQLSNQFTGLSPGVYSIVVREQATTSCNDSQSFAVNAAAVGFDFTMVITNETVSGAADGSIAVNVTGSGGPFTYSKDGGSNYQAGNLFENLAPGTYTIVVKDASENIVAKNATILAGLTIFEKVYFSKNPIWWEAQQTANSVEDNYKIFLDVRVEDVPGSGNYVSKFKAAISPENDGISRFQLRQAFRGSLEANPPNQNDTSILKLTDRIKLYKNYYGDIFDDLIEPDTFSASNPFRVLLGGLSKFQFPQTLYFSDYLPNNLKFMSWAPQEKIVDANQEDYLQFFIYNSDITTIKLMIKGYFDDETDETAEIQTVAGTGYGELYQIPAGPINSGVVGIDPAKNLVKYDLWINDQDDTPISEIRTFRYSDLKQPSTRYILFLNSLGAYEVARLTGFTETMVEFDGEIFEKYLPRDYSALDGQFEAGQTTRQRKFKYSSGHMPDKNKQQWIEYFEDMLTVRKMYDITSGSRVPIIASSQGITIKRYKSNNVYARFEAMESYRDHSYSPDTI